MEHDILIVISEQDRAGQLVSDLSLHGLRSTLAQSARDAIRLLHTKSFAFLLLEISTVGADLLLELAMYGFQGVFPYLIVAADFTSGLTRAEFLERGADACIEMPTNAVEVAAEIRAALRRSGRVNLLKGKRLPIKVEHLDMNIDPAEYTVSMGGTSVSLTAKEFEILYFLASYPGIVFSKEQIYENVWECDYACIASSVPDHIYSLRRKLGLDAKDNRYIETVRGVGYRFCREN